MAKRPRASLGRWLALTSLVVILVAVSFALGKAVMFFRFFSQLEAGEDIPPTAPNIEVPAGEVNPAPVTAGEPAKEPSVGPVAQPDPGRETDTPVSPPDPAPAVEPQPAPALPAVPTELAAAAKDVSAADKAAAARIILTKLSTADINHLMSLANGGITPEKKSEALGILHGKLTEEEFNLVVNLAYKYKDTIKKALGK